MYFRVKAWKAFELRCWAVFCYPQENFQCHKRIWEIFILQELHWVDEDCDGVQQLWVHWRIHFHLPLHHRCSMWSNYVCTFLQSNVASVIITRLLPARMAAALSCKSLVEGVSYSFFSWWPPSVGEDSAAWGVDEQQMGISDQKICTWRCELEVRNWARERSRKSGGRWQKVGQQGVWFGDKENEMNKTCDEWPLHRTGEQGWIHAVCRGRIAYSVLFFKTRNWAQKTCLRSMWQKTLCYSKLVWSAA